MAIIVRTGSFGAWLEPRPRGLGVSSCGFSRSSKRGCGTQAVSAHRMHQEEGDDCAAALQRHRFVRGVAGATSQGALCVELRRHRFVRGVAGATPQGALCVELRLKPQLNRVGDLASMPDYNHWLHLRTKGTNRRALAAIDLVHRQLVFSCGGAETEARKVWVVRRDVARNRHLGHRAPWWRL